MIPAANFPMVWRTGIPRKMPKRGAGRKKMDVPKKKVRKKKRLWSRLLFSAAFVRARRKGGQKKQFDTFATGYRDQEKVSRKKGQGPNDCWRLS